MPITKCQRKGKKGHQWGDQKCYTGPNSKKKAKQQRQAAYASGYKK